MARQVLGRVGGVRNKGLLVRSVPQVSGSFSGTGKSRVDAMDSANKRLKRWMWVGW